MSHLDTQKGLAGTNDSSPGMRRNREHFALVRRYYRQVTPFYEFAWGSSFHFSPRMPGESLADSHQRQEAFIGAMLSLKAGMEVADLGCGIGGPMVTIAKTTGASITGINISGEQVARGKKLLRKSGLTETCRFLHADFMDVPMVDDSFDAMYSFEAICHAPDKEPVFRELYRLLKPGGEIVVIDWCLTDRYDDAVESHRAARAGIEKGNMLGKLLRTGEQVEAIRAAGFQVAATIDQHEEWDSRSPWYMGLQSRDLSLTSLARIPAGRRVTAALTKTLEKLRVLPQGASEAAELLNLAADSLVEAGELGIFTPGFIVHARKADSGQREASDQART